MLHSEGGLALGKRTLLKEGSVVNDDDYLIPKVDSLCGGRLFLLMVLMHIDMRAGLLIILLTIAIRALRRGGGR